MRKSISRNIYFFTSKVILYLLKRQQTVAQSTTEVEYYVLAKADYRPNNILKYRY